MTEGRPDTGTEVVSETVDGLSALTLRSAALAVTVVPELGGKIASVRRRATDGVEEEVLWRNPHRRLALPHYASAYGDYDASGYDECFPGIGEGPLPAATWGGVANPDHGEVWALPWRVEEAAGEGAQSVRLAVHGVRFPYLLEREASFVAPGRLVLRYRVSNHAALDMPYIWSAHPLFAVTSTTRVVLPAGVTSLMLDSSIGGRLGAAASRVGWPLSMDAGGHQVDLSRLTPGAGYGDKLYTTAVLEEGWCALYDEATGGYAGFAFDPAEVPHLGVWINQDGWPAGGPTCFNVALEPCTGWPDDLTQAAQRGTLRVLPAHSTHEWTVVLAVGHAPSAAEIGADRWREGV